MDHKGLSFTHVPHIKEILNLIDMKVSVYVFSSFGTLYTHAEITIIFKAYFCSISEQSKRRIGVGNREKGYMGLLSRELRG